MTAAGTTDARVARHALEIDIRAPRDAVWHALTRQLHAWWLPDFHVLGDDSSVQLDARAGGQLVEQRPDGAGLLWYTVTLCLPGEALHLAGHASPAWGGPHTSVLVLTLDDAEGGTRLHVDESLVGHVADEHLASAASGWRRLLGEGLKNHAEASDG